MTALIYTHGRQPADDEGNEMTTITFTAAAETSDKAMRAARKLARELPWHDVNYAQWTIRVVRGDGPRLAGRMENHPAAASLFATLLGTIERASHE